MPDSRAALVRAWPLVALLFSQIPLPANAKEHTGALSQMRQAAEEAAETEPPRLRLPGVVEQTGRPSDRSRRQAVHEAVTRELRRESLERQRMPPSAPEEAAHGQGGSAQSRAEAAQAQAAKHGADVDDQRGKGRGKGNGNGNGNGQMNNAGAERAQQIPKADVAVPRDKGSQKGPGGGK